MELGVNYPKPIISIHEVGAVIKGLDRCTCLPALPPSSFGHFMPLRVIPDDPSSFGAPIAVYPEPAAGSRGA